MQFSQFLKIHLLLSIAAKETEDPGNWPLSLLLGPAEANLIRPTQVLLRPADGARAAVHLQVHRRRSISSSLALPTSMTLPSVFRSRPSCRVAHTAHAAVGERLGDGGFFKRGEGEGSAGGRLCHGRHRQYTRAAAVCAGRPGGLVEVTAAWEPARAGAAVGLTRVGGLGSLRNASVMDLGSAAFRDLGRHFPTKGTSQYDSDLAPPGQSKL